MLKNLFIYYKRIFFLQIILIISIIDSAYGAGASSKFINIVVDDSLYYPFNLLVNKFIQNSDVIVNIKYVNNSFYKNLSYDEKINIFITQKNNKNIIEKFFNIKASNFIGMTTYCLCANKDHDLKNFNILSLNDLEKSNVVRSIGVGSINSAFFLNRKFQSNKGVSEYDDGLLAIQDLYLKKYDVGLFLYPMCSLKKNMMPIYIINSIDVKNNNHFMRDYRIFIVNNINTDVQNFFSLFENLSEINELMKDYGIVGKNRQFSQN